MGILGDLSKGIVIWMGICTLFGVIVFANMTVREPIAAAGTSVIIAILFLIVVWDFVIRNEL